jgi:hypothetical protein
MPKRRAAKPRKVVAPATWTELAAPVEEELPLLPLEEPPLPLELPSGASVLEGSDSSPRQV